MMSYRADKLGVDAHARTHTQTDTGNDNTRRPKLASGKKVVQITEAQAGGIPGSATVDHIIVMKQTINEIRNKGKTAYLVFLDVQKAYDKAWLDAILYVLHKNGVKGKNLHMVQKLNSNLTAKIHTRHGLTREIRIRDSIRQGGVLSVVEYEMKSQKSSKYTTWESQQSLAKK